MRQPKLMMDPGRAFAPLRYELIRRSRQPARTKQLTVVMPFLNEGEEPRRTVESIHRTAPADALDIIAIDDASDGSPDTLQDFGNVAYVRNEQRIGGPASKHLGVTMARTPYVLIIDGHMRFRRAHWHRKIVRALSREPSTAFCATCLGLSAENMDVQTPHGRYYGANLLLDSGTPTDPRRPAREILEPRWAPRPRKQKRSTKIGCVLGASYAFTRDWFLRIRGLEGLQGWGAEEPFLSLKTWLAGGRCRLLRNVEIGHRFRQRAPYRTPVAHLVYNKIFICRTVLPEDVGERLLLRLPRDAAFEHAMRMIDENAEYIRECRGYYASLFTTTLEQVCRRAGIRFPDP